MELNIFGSRYPTLYKVDWKYSLDPRFQEQKCFVVALILKKQRGANFNKALPGTSLAILFECLQFSLKIVFIVIQYYYKFSKVNTSCRTQCVCLSFKF